MGWKLKRVRLPRTAVLLAMLAVASLPSSAAAAMVSNGSFETGNFSGWTSQNVPASGNDGWFVYAGTVSPLTSTPISAPPVGTFGAVTDQTAPGAHFLYQDLVLEPGLRQTLTLYVYYRTGAAINSPESLDSTVSPNQQYRIDLIKPSAAITSVSSNDVLANVFRTPTGAPQTLQPTKVTVDLTPYGGQTVRLRFAEVDNLGIFQASVDGVSIDVSNQFTFGKLTRNLRKGIATLPVDVPNPGTLGLTGKGLKTQRLATADASASKIVSAAGRVNLKLRAMGKKRTRLNATGKVKVAATITFTPTGGQPFALTRKVTLRKRH
jgi:hypothetical protein